MLCPKCSAANEGGAQVCRSCGAAMVSAPGAARPVVPPVSTGFYLGSVAGAGLFGVLMLTLASARVMRNPYDIGAMPLLLLGEVVLFYAAVVAIVLWYRAWKAIQDGHARTTPGKAVGFMFIPFYNFYWVFQAYWGFAKDYNAFLQRHAIYGARLPEWVFLASCILTVTSIVIAFIPFLRLVVPFASLAAWTAVTWFVCSAVNNLADHPPVPA